MSVHRTIGVEKEFHVVDTRTRRLAPRAGDILSRLSPQAGFVEELQQCVVESNSAVCDDLAALGRDVRQLRIPVSEAAAALGLAWPRRVRRRWPRRVNSLSPIRPGTGAWLAEYQLLAREQLICGTQVHVQVDDRDEAVQIAARVNAYVPALLALSVSSPFAFDGTDTGYASSRTLVWRRWPTAGPFPTVDSAVAYDTEIAQLRVAECFPLPAPRPSSPRCRSV